MYRLNSEVNVFHYGILFCVLTMITSSQILIIVRGKSVVLTLKNKYLHILCLLQEVKEFGVRQGTMRPPFSYIKVSNPSKRA